jgi:hypothetical protein
MLPRPILREGLRSTATLSDSEPTSCRQSFSATLHPKEPKFLTEVSVVKARTALVKQPHERGRTPHPP